MTDTVLTGLGLTLSVLALGRSVFFFRSRWAHAFSASQPGNARALPADRLHHRIGTQRLPRGCVAQPNGHLVASELTKAQAEDLLDWLEAHGCKSVELDYTARGFTVRCPTPR